MQGAVELGMLKPIGPHDHDKKGFFLWFDRQFDRMTARYEKGVVAMLKRAGRSRVYR